MPHGVCSQKKKESRKHRDRRRSSTELAEAYDTMPPAAAGTATARVAGHKPRPAGEYGELGAHTVYEPGPGRDQFGFDANDENADGRGQFGFEANDENADAASTSDKVES